jgi:hypothetical protein
VPDVWFEPAAGGVMRHVVGGRYGLGSKDFTPAMAKAVYDNLKADKPKDKFTVRRCYNNQCRYIVTFAKYPQQNADT